MSALSKDAEFWSKISRKYAADPIRNVPAYLNTLERTKSYLSIYDNVLEVGCGTGSTALLLAPSVAHITATDIAPGMIEIANEKREEAGFENVTFKVAEILEHNCGDSPFEAVLAHNLLHLVPDLDGALDRVASLTKSGGVFISKTVCAPDNGRLKYVVISRVAIPIMQALGKAPFVNFVTAPELERKIERSGFKILETFDQSGLLPSRYIVARKQ